MSIPNPSFADQEFLAGCGIWMNKSLFNHSCIPNCRWTYIGDHIFVETTRNVHAREELSLSYLDPNTTFSVREEIFSRWIDPAEDSVASATCVPS